MEKVINLPKIDSKKRSDIVYSILYEKIVSGEYLPGHQLDLNNIEKQLGISRTPLKLALHRLELEGLIEIKPQYGTFVTVPNPQQIKEAFDVRMMIETFIIEFVIKNITNTEFHKLERIINKLDYLEDSTDPDKTYIKLMEIDRNFHRSLVKLSNNSIIKKIYDSVNVYPHITRLFYRVKDKDLQIARKEHREIIEGLRNRDIEKTRNALIQHCKRSANSTLKALEYYEEIV